MYGKILATERDKSAGQKEHNRRLVVDGREIYAKVRGKWASIYASFTATGRP